MGARCSSRALLVRSSSCRARWCLRTGDPSTCPLKSSWVVSFSALRLSEAVVRLGVVARVEALRHFLSGARLDPVGAGAGRCRLLPAHPLRDSPRSIVRACKRCRTGKGSPPRRSTRGSRKREPHSPVPGHILLRPSMRLRSRLMRLRSRLMRRNNRRPRGSSRRAHCRSHCPPRGGPQRTSPILKKTTCRLSFRRHPASKR